MSEKYDFGDGCGWLFKRNCYLCEVKLKYLYIMDDDEMLYRQMNEEDPYYAGPRCDDPKRKKSDQK